MRTNIFTFFSLFLVVALLFSCKKTDWSVTVNTKVKFVASSNEITIAGKQFVMEEIRIDLSELRITGNRIQSDPIDVVLANNANTDFLNSTAVKSFDLPIGTYPEMSFSTAVTSGGTPSFHISGTYYLANGDTYDVIIDLDINQDIITRMTDDDGSTTILVETDFEKCLTVALDIEMLFSDLTPGLWNAAAVTNNNGSQTVQVDALNNSNIYNAISGKIGDSFVARFK